MLVFLEQSLLIYAPPKTGTTALHRALAPHADLVLRGPAKHISTIRAEKKLLPLLSSLNAPMPQGFAIIREPIDWLHSWYRYRTRPDVSEDKSTATLSFDTFVNAYLEHDRPAFARIGQQSKFLSGGGTLSVRHLFAYDHMDHAVEFLNKRLGLTFGLEWVNASPEVKLDLSSENRNRLKHHFAADYALYQNALNCSTSFEPPR
ncbi:MAG: gamma-glutamyl kinase [Pseudomonadota bacterium]